MKSRFLLFGLLCALFLPTNGRADLQQLPAALFSRPAPEIDWGKILDARIQAGEPLPDLPPSFSPPPDDATPSVHLAHWRVDWAWREKEALPTAVARQKILNAVHAEPAAIPEVLRALPETEAAAREIEVLLPKLASTTPEGEKRIRAVKAWIFRHSGLHREEVIADARRAEWELYRWRERPDPVLAALQAREPGYSITLLEELAIGGNPGLAVAAALLLSEQAAPSAKGRWHQQLISAAANPLLPEAARSIAMDALIDQDWPGREAWIFSCLQQPDPGEIHGYDSAISAQPERWIPLLTPMVGGDNRAAHNHAVYLLAQRIESHTWNDEASEAQTRLKLAAAGPLLPWLMDAKWADSPDHLGRLRLIQSLEEIHLPEAVPGLLKIVREGTEWSDVAYAAQSLVRYRPPDAAPDLEGALRRCNDLHYRTIIIAALHRLGGFDLQERIAAVEAHLQAHPEEGTFQDNRDEAAENPAVDVGGFLLNELPEDHALREGLEERANALENDQAQLAGAIRNLLASTSTAPSAAMVARLIETGMIGEEALAAALQRRREPGWDGTAFRALLDGKGAARGFAAVLSGDPAAVSSALADGDKEAQVAVFAAAGLSGDPVEIDRLSALLSAEDEAVRDAAETYLTRSKLPGLVKFRNLKMPGWDPANGNYGEFSSTVKDLSARLGIKEQPVEIFSLRSFIQGSGATQWILVIYPDRTVAVQYSRDGSLFTADVSPEQLGEVRSFIQTYRSDDLPPLELPMMDGTHYSYQHACSTGVRRVWMNNPPASREAMLDWIEIHKVSKGIVHYGRLVLLFSDLFAKLPLRPSYGEGIEILIPRDKARIRSVWKQGDDMRVLVANSLESIHWQEVSTTTGQLVGPAAEPEESSFLQARADLHPEFRIASEHHFRYPWQVRSGDSTIHSGGFREAEGLWRCRRGKEPDLVANGTYLGELVSLDGKWCIAAKQAGDTWAEPNGLVRINLETKLELPVDLEPADDLWPLAFLEAHGKFLIRRAGSGGSYDNTPSVGPDEPEFHLLDPATGAVERANGDFTILGERSYRPLQPTTVPASVWAADRGGGELRIGKYDTRLFRFETVKSITGPPFQSDSMWIDEAGGFIYAALNEDLVRIPLH